MKLSKDSIAKILIFFLLLTTFLPLFYANAPTPFRSFRFFWGPLWLIFFVIFETKLFQNKLVLRFAGYGIIFGIIFPLLIWQNLDDWYREFLYKEIYVYAIAITTFVYIYDKRYTDLPRQIVILILVFIGITAIMSIITLSIDPMYARKMTAASSGYSTSEEGIYMSKYGGGTYSYGQSIAIMIPVLVYYYKNSHLVIWSKKVIGLYLLLILFTLLRMQFFANIIVGFTGLAISLAGLKNIRISVSIVVLLLIFAISIPKSIYINALLEASTYFDANSENAFKLKEAATFLEYGGQVSEQNAVGDRVARYPELIEAFVHRPFFGNFLSNSPYDIGKAYHIYLGARLATVGIFLFLIYIWFHYLFIRIGFRRIKNTSYIFYYLLAIIMFISLALMKNISGRDVWFTYFLLIPFAYNLSKNTKKNQLLKNDK